MSNSVTAAAARGRETGRVRRRFDLDRSGLYFAGLLLLALIAFWPSYLSRLGANTAYTHLHAVTATLWMSMLIVQPIAIRTGRRPLHRMLGRISYGLVPVVVISVVLLAHSRIAGAAASALPRRTYVLYLQTSLVALFGLSFLLAVLTRHSRALHARFMVCTGLTLIDPVFARLLFWVERDPGWNYQWLTFGLTDLLSLALVWMERDSRRGRRVFPAMLLVFVAAQTPAVLGWTESAGWQAFAGWFAGLPLT